MDKTIRHTRDRNNGDAIEKITYTRDYWRKVYAGRNLAQCVDVFGYDAFNAPEKFAEYCDNLAIALVNRMFPEDQS